MYENDTDIFRSYSRSNSFRGIQICSYSSPDIQHLISYPYPNTQIAYLWCWYLIVSYPAWLTLSANPDRNMKTNIISKIFVRIRSVFIPIHDHRNRRVEVVDRSRLPLSILKNITQEHTGDKYTRGAISSLANVDVHVVALYRCL